MHFILDKKHNSSIACYRYLFFLSILIISLFMIVNVCAQANNSQNQDLIKEHPNTCQMYFITTRLNEGSSKRPSYGGTRHFDLGKGTTECGIVAINKPNDLLSPSVSDSGLNYKRMLKQASDAWRNSSLVFVSNIEEENLYARIHDWKGRIAVYVHGYDKPFQQAVQDASMLFNDYKQYETSSDKKLLPVVFSWPSDGGKTQYGNDEANLEWSFPAFDNFMEKLISEKSPDSPLTIITHSMGARLVLSYLNKHPQKNSIQNIFLCAPDLDFRTAELQKETFENAVKDRVFIVVSDRDKPLILSGYIHGQPRLGRPLDPPKFTTQTNQLFSSEYLMQLSLDANDLLMGNGYTDPPDLISYIKSNPLVDCEYGQKSRFIDVSEIVQLDMGHGVPWSIISAIMADRSIKQLKTNIVHKRPERAYMQQCKGKPPVLYRFWRYMPNTN